MGRQRYDGRQSRALHHVERDLRLAAPVDRLGDEEVGPFIDGPCDLLLEHGAHGRVGRLVVGLIGIGVADVSRHQAAMAISDVPGDPESLPVDVFQNILSADYPELLAMSVISEGFHDVAAGMHEIVMQPLDHLRILDYRLRHESARLKVAAPLQLEEIAFRADDWAAFQAIEEARLHGLVRLGGGHVDDLLYSLGSHYSRFPGGAFAGRRKEVAHALRTGRERLTAVEPRDLARGFGSSCGAHIFGVGQVLNQHRNMSSGLGSAPDLDSTGGATRITPFPSMRGRYGRWLEADALHACPVD